MGIKNKMRKEKIIDTSRRVQSDFLRTFLRELGLILTI